MRTLFTNAPFSRFDLGRHALLSSSEGAYSIFSSLLNDVGVSEEDVNKLFDKIPSSLVGSYQKQLDACKAMDITSSKGAACLAKLYIDMKAAADKAAVAAPRPPAAPSSFPVVPVMVGLAVAGGLIYVLVKKG